MKNKIIEMTGRKVGRLTVLEYKGKNKFKEAIWLCECECGNKIVTTGSKLRSGVTKSCGCLQKETASRQIRRFNNSPYHITTGNFRHGETKTHLHRVWCNMRRRCRDKNNRRYGGRGIKVCQEWDCDYLAFKKWAIENGYKEGLEIDRIDVNGNYEPGNCKWATRKEQMRNTCNTVYITIGGETKPLVQWCEEKGFPYKLAIERYEKGYGPELVFSSERIITPPKKYRKDITPEKVLEMMKQGHSPYRIAKMLNTDFETVRSRVMMCNPNDLPEKWRKKVVTETVFTDEKGTVNTNGRMDNEVPELREIGVRQL